MTARYHLPKTVLCKWLIFNDTKAQFYSPIPKLWERPLSPSNFEGVPEGRGSLYTTLFFNTLFTKIFILKKFLYKLPRPAVRLGNPLIKVIRIWANRRPPLQNLKGIWGTPPSQKVGMADGNCLHCHCFLFEKKFLIRKSEWRRGYGTLLNFQFSIFNSFGYS